MKKNIIKLKILATTILLFLNLGLLQSQNSKSFQLNFEPMFNEQHLVLNDTFYKINNGQDSVQITKLKFYISSVQFYNNDKLVFAEKNSYHLIDASNSNTLHINVNLPSTSITKFNAIKFNIGIDSATNAKGALGGELDPTKGMYWAWHSGYINLKLEGTSNICNTRNNVFEFHLGGFTYPNNSLQTVQLNLTNKTNATISVDINKFLSKINLAKTNAIMTPSKETIELSKLAKTIFVVKK